MQWDPLSDGTPPSNDSNPITPMKFDEGVFSGATFLRKGQTGGRAVASADQLRRVGSQLFEGAAKRVSRMDRFVFVPFRRPRTELISETYTYDIAYADGAVTDTVTVTGKVSYDPDDPGAPYYQELREQGLDYELQMVAYEDQGEYWYQEEGHVPSRVRGQPDQVRAEVEEKLSDDQRTDAGVYWSEYAGSDGSLVAWEQTWTHRLDSPDGNPTVTDSAEQQIAIDPDGYWVETSATYQDRWGPAPAGRQETEGDWVVVSSTGHEQGNASDGARWAAELFADGHQEGAFWDERGDLEFRYLVRADGSEVWWDAAGNVVAETAPGESWFDGYWVFDPDSLEWALLDEATLRVLPLYYWAPGLDEPAPLTDEPLPSDGVYLYDDELVAWVYVSEEDLVSLSEDFAEGVDELWPNYRWDPVRREAVPLDDNDWPSGEGDWLRVAELPGWVWVAAGDESTAPTAWLEENQERQRRGLTIRRRSARQAEVVVSRFGARAHTPLPRSVRRSVVLTPSTWRGR